MPSGRRCRRPRATCSIRFEVIEQYGTDATRFTLAAMAAPGTDIAFNPSRTEGYRNFANKIWNAARFMFMNLDRIGEGVARAPSPAEAGGLGVAGFKAETLEDRWILSRFNGVAAYVNEALEEFRFHEAANRIYDFFWGEFCDWYIELIKPRLMFEEGADKSAAQIACAQSGGLVRSVLAPAASRDAVHHGRNLARDLRRQAAAEVDCAGRVPAGRSEADRLEVRDAHGRAAGPDRQRTQPAGRAESRAQGKGTDPGLRARTGDPDAARAESRSDPSDRQANVESIAFVESSLAKLPGARHTARFDVHLVYEQKIDVAAECARLKKELDKLEKDIASGQTPAWQRIVSWPRRPPKWWRACASRVQKTKPCATRRRAKARSWGAR